MPPLNDRCSRRHDQQPSPDVAFMSLHRRSRRLWVQSADQVRLWQVSFLLFAAASPLSGLCFPAIRAALMETSAQRPPSSASPKTKVRMGTKRSCRVTPTTRRHLWAPSSKLARSRADRPTPVHDPAQSSAGAPQTVRGIRDSDDVPLVRATSDFRLCRPLESTAAAHTHSPCIPLARAQNPARLYRSGADPSSQMPKFRQCQCSFGGESFQQLPALMILQSSIWRFHSSNSQTVRAISVTPSAENCAAIWRINSNS